MQKVYFGIFNLNAVFNESSAKENIYHSWGAFHII